MPKRKLPPDDKVVEMYESGMSSGEIAEKCNVKPTTVLSLFRKIEYKTRSRKDAARLMVKKGRYNKVPYWKGKKQPPEMVEKRISKIRGEKHYLWKGGNSRREYRGVIEKILCSDCGGKLNLGIHHKDLDHYNNEPENLDVLCVSCHITLHKLLYWKSKRDGTEYKTNSPIGWNKK